VANHRTLIAAVLILIGVIALAVGIIYLTVEANSLPSVLGSLHGYTGHRTKRGIAALIIGGVLVVVGGGIALSRPRS
jgi:uncharacterized membrane protein YidH (DUF202 family)